MTADQMWTVGVALLVLGLGMWLGKALVPTPEPTFQKPDTVTQVILSTSCHEVARARVSGSQDSLQVIVCTVD